MTRRDPAATTTLLAPISGVLVPLDQVPDPAFAQRLAGDGIAIDPLGQTIVAPCDARVLQVHRAGHALTLDVSGLEILIHVGLDTVKLNGKGFKPNVKAGYEVRKGDTLLTFDADYVATHALSLISPVLVTNMDRVTSLRPASGKVRAGQDLLMEIGLGTRAAGDGAQFQREAVRSGPVVITHESGLHARPAAVVAAAARQFTSDVRLVKGDREANARSLVSIMALEVGRGDAVTIVARGEDAEHAIAEISRTLTADLAASHGAVPAAKRQSDREAVAPRAAPPPSRDDGALRGVPASPGVAVGQVFQLRHDDAVVEEWAADANHERRELDAAIASAHLQLEAMRSRMATE